VQGLGFKVYGAGCRVEGSWISKGNGLRIEGLGVRVYGFGF